MAAVVPLVGAFIAGGSTIAGVGAALAGASGFAAFAGVAGGIMSGIGMLTGSKTLTKVGGLLGLAGAVAGVASAVSDGASSAWSGTGNAAGTEAGIAESAAGSDAAQFGKYAKAGDTLAQATSEAAGTAGQAAAGGAASSGGAPLNLNADPYMAALDQPGQNLMEQARLARTLPVGQQPAAAVADGSDYGLMTRGAATASPTVGAAQDQALAKLAEAGSQIKDRTALETMLGKLNGAAQWIEQNPTTAKLAGNVLQGGMQMYASNDATNQQLNLIEQRRRRLNSPVALGMLPQINRTPGG